jgi:hypothetical protein
MLDRGETRVLSVLKLRDRLEVVDLGSGSPCIVPQLHSCTGQPTIALGPAPHPKPHLCVPKNLPHLTSHFRTNSPPKSQYSRNFNLPPPPSHDDDLRQPISTTHPTKSPPTPSTMAKEAPRSGLAVGLNKGHVCLTSWRISASPS